MGTLFVLARGGSPRIFCEPTYLFAILSALETDPGRSGALREAARAVLSARNSPTDGSAWLQLQNVLDREAGSRAPGAEYGAEPGADRATVSEAAARDSPPASAVLLYLENIRSPFNAGNIIRSAAAFGIAGVFLSTGCPALEHPRLQRAAMGATEMIECRRGTLEESRQFLWMLSGEPGKHGLPGLPVLYALETGGAPIGQTRLALPAVVILGHEEHGVTLPLLEEARRSGGVLTIPHRGPKQSLNVGVAAGILLHHLCGHRCNEKS